MTVRSSLVLAPAEAEASSPSTLTASGKPWLLLPGRLTDEPLRGRSSSGGRNEPPGGVVASASKDGGWLMNVGGRRLEEAADNNLARRHLWMVGRPRPGSPFRLRALAEGHSLLFEVVESGDGPIGAERKGNKAKRDQVQVPGRTTARAILVVFRARVKSINLCRI